MAGTGIPVALLLPPGNTSFSPPLISEWESLTSSAAGYFRFHRGSLTPHASEPQLLLLLADAEHAGARRASGALRSLVTLSSRPLALHLIGTADTIRRSLTSASVSSTHTAESWRALRTHRYAAMPLRLPVAYESALRCAYRGCAHAALRDDMIRLMAPLLLPHTSSLIAVDALSLWMVDPTHLWHQLEAMAPSDCVAAGRDPWVGGSSFGTSLDNSLDPSLLLMRPKAMRNSNWAPRLERALSLALATGCRGGGEVAARAECPRALFSSLLARAPASTPRSLQQKRGRMDGWGRSGLRFGLRSGLRSGLRASARGERGDARCISAIELAPTRAYQPLAHVTSGLQQLAVGRTDGVATSLYVICRHEIVHQAFAWHAERQFRTRYPTGGGCGRRLSIVLPPRLQSGQLLWGSHRAEDALPALMGPSAPALTLWENWANHRSALSLRRAAASAVAVPPRVFAMADRSEGARGELVLFDVRERPHSNPRSLSTAAVKRVGLEWGGVRVGGVRVGGGRDRPAARSHLPVRIRWRGRALYHKAASLAMLTQGNSRKFGHFSPHMSHASVARIRQTHLSDASLRRICRICHNHMPQPYAKPICHTPSFSST